MDNPAFTMEQSIEKPVADLYPIHSPEAAVYDPDNIRPEQLDHLVSTVEAAQAVGANPQNIRDWKRHGHLHPSGLDKYGRPLYKLIDVLKADQKVSQPRARKVKP